MARLSWFSEEGDAVLFQSYVERMESWQKAIADGTINSDEVQLQAQNVANLLRALEGKLDDDLHDQVSEAFMEWAVLQGMMTNLVMSEQQSPSPAAS